MHFVTSLAHLLHGHSGHGHLYLSCVNVFILYIVNKTPVVGFSYGMLYAQVHQVMWYTTSGHGHLY